MCIHVTYMYVLLLFQPFTLIKNQYFIDKINPSFSAIKVALSPSNYCNKFHHLLFWEELQHIKELNKRYSILRCYIRTYVASYVVLSFLIAQYGIIMQLCKSASHCDDAINWYKSMIYCL